MSQARWSLVVMVLCACSSVPPMEVVDASVDAGFTCPKYYVPSSCDFVGAQCSVHIADDPCTTECVCNADGTWHCTAQCPQMDCCNVGSYCRAGTTVCSTDDAGCELRCSSRWQRIDACKTVCPE